MCGNSTHSLEWISSHWLSHSGQKIGNTEWKPCETHHTDVINQKLACLPASFSTKTRSQYQLHHQETQLKDFIWVFLFFTEENKIECRRGGKKVTWLRAQPFEKSTQQKRENKPFFCLKNAKFLPKHWVPIMPRHSCSLCVFFMHMTKSVVKRQGWGPGNLYF